MGTSTDGILAYGYNLGGGDDDLDVKESQKSDTNPYGYLKTSWYDAEHDEMPDEDGRELSIYALLIRQLYQSIPDAPPAKYDWQQEKIVKEHLGVELISYCHVDNPMWILTTHEIRVARGKVEVIDWRALDEQAFAGEWDSKLANALLVLGLTPLQAKAGWVLASDWG